MIPQILLVKQLYLEADTFIDRGDSVSAGVAISLLQDAAELYVWTLIKERNVTVKDQSGFVANLEAVQKAGFAMPFSARLLELNRARVNFKHYGNLPAESEARKHRAYVEDCLREAMDQHFGISFDQISLIDLVADPDVRKHLSQALAHTERGELVEAVAELAKARYLAIQAMRRLAPRVDRRLADADRLLSTLAGGSHINVFEYLTQYLEQLQDSMLISTMQLPAADFALIQHRLPQASRSHSGAWQVVHTRGNYTEAECRRAIACLINLCLRVQARP